MRSNLKALVCCSVVVRSLALDRFNVETQVLDPDLQILLQFG